MDKPLWDFIKNALSHLHTVPLAVTDPTSVLTDFLGLKFDDLKLKVNFHIRSFSCSSFSTTPSERLDSAGSTFEDGYLTEKHSFFKLESEYSDKQLGDLLVFCSSVLAAILLHWHALLISSSFHGDSACSPSTPQPLPQIEVAGSMHSSNVVTSFLAKKFPIQDTIAALVDATTQYPLLMRVLSYVFTADMTDAKATHVKRLRSYTDMMNGMQLLAHSSHILDMDEPYILTDFEPFLLSRGTMYEFFTTTIMPLHIIPQYGALAASATCTAPLAGSTLQAYVLDDTHISIYYLFCSFTSLLKRDILFDTAQVLYFPQIVHYTLFSIVFEGSLSDLNDQFSLRFRMPSARSFSGSAKGKTNAHNPFNLNFFKDIYPRRDLTLRSFSRTVAVLSFVSRLIHDMKLLASTGRRARVEEYLLKGRFLDRLLHPLSFIVSFFLKSDASPRTFRDLVLLLKGNQEISETLALFSAESCQDLHGKRIPIESMLCSFDRHSLLADARHEVLYPMLGTLLDDVFTVEVLQFLSALRDIFRCFLTRSVLSHMITTTPASVSELVCLFQVLDVFICNSTSSSPAPDSHHCQQLSQFLSHSYTLSRSHASKQSDAQPHSSKSSTPASTADSQGCLKLAESSSTDSLTDLLPAYNSLSSHLEHVLFHAVQNTLRAPALLFWFECAGYTESQTIDEDIVFDSDISNLSFVQIERDDIPRYSSMLKSHQKIFETSVVLFINKAIAEINKKGSFTVRTESLDSIQKDEPFIGRAVTPIGISLVHLVSMFFQSQIQPKYLVADQLFPAHTRLSDAPTSLGQFQYALLRNVLLNVKLSLTASILKSFLRDYKDNTDTIASAEDLLLATGVADALTDVDNRYSMYCITVSAIFTLFVGLHASTKTIQNVSGGVQLWRRLLTQAFNIFSLHTNDDMTALSPDSIHACLDSCASLRDRCFCVINTLSAFIFVTQCLTFGLMSAFSTSSSKQWARNLIVTCSLSGFWSCDSPLLQLTESAEGSPPLQVEVSISPSKTKDHPGPVPSLTTPRSGRTPTIVRPLQTRKSVDLSKPGAHSIGGNNGRALPASLALRPSTVSRTKSFTGRQTHRPGTKPVSGKLTITPRLSAIPTSQTPSSISKAPFSVTESPLIATVRNISVAASPPAPPIPTQQDFARLLSLERKSLLASYLAFQCSSIERVRTDIRDIQENKTSNIKCFDPALSFPVLLLEEFSAKNKSAMDLLSRTIDTFGYAALATSFKHQLGCLRIDASTEPVGFCVDMLSNGVIIGLIKRVISLLVMSKENAPDAAAPHLLIVRHCAPLLKLLLLRLALLLRYFSEDGVHAHLALSLASVLSALGKLFTRDELLTSQLDQDILQGPPTP